MNFFKFLATIAIASTGIGLFYLIAKTRVINQGYRGITYDEGKLKILEPGVHLLLSPLHVFDREISVKSEVIQLRNFEIKTADNIPTMVQADFTYLVENAEKAILGVDKYEESINESAKSTLASILTGHKFADLNTFTMNPSQVIPAENPAAQSSDRSQFLSTIAHSFLDKLHEVCESWGIKVSNLRIVSVEAKDPQIGNAIAQTALTYLQSQNQLAAAKAKAAITETEARAAALQRQIKADAKAYARITQAKSEIDAAAALNDAANKLTNPIAQSMYGMKNRENIASALSATQGTLAIGSKFALFPSANSSNSLSSLPNRPGMVNG